jgi:hypothetical protein
VKTLKIIERIAAFFSIVSAVFVVLSAISTIELINIASGSAPTDYIIVYTILDLLPYLFLMALSLVVTIICRRAGKEKREVPAPPQTEEKTEEINF